MQKQHTPGPWKFYTKPQPNGCPIVGTNCGLMVAMLAHTVRQPEQADEAIANARLIAAAPDLLEALKDAYPHIGDDALRARIGAVICKAEGV